VGNIQPITVTKGRYKLSEALRIARNLSTLPHLLRYQDRASMSNSVESRVPFVSKPILNFANKIAEKQHFSEEGLGKDILIKALDGIIPNKLAKRRDKKGFDLKRRKWIKGLDPIAQDLLNSNEAKNCSILNIEKSKNIWNCHKNINSQLNSYPWRIISFLQWKKLFKIEI
ncbi:MAG: hypothetical protein HN564_01060, partial [Flavobacteriales bacterium]|nr:hypothetical protein [Flavobacteriales bacterium]